jgi:hypothetical protein
LEVEEIDKYEAKERKPFLNGVVNLISFIRALCLQLLAYTSL